MVSRKGPQAQRTVRVVNNVQDAAAALADIIRDASAAAVQSNGRFTVALAGGASPIPAYRLLATDPYVKQVQWDRWHVFWGDERCVPRDSPDSNFKAAWDAFLKVVPVPPRQVHRIAGEEPPVRAASVYEDQLRGAFRPPAASCFDLVILGMGADGHTASLFPGSPALQERERLAVAVKAPVPPSDRVTLTLPVLNGAARAVFVVNGSDKAQSVRLSLNPLPGEQTTPAGMVRPASGALVWLVTRDAARFLTY